MKYFIIHSGKDWLSHVKPLVESWANYCDKKAKFIVLNGTQEDWLDDATAKIRQAEKIIYVVGENSSKSENIEKEIAIALREKKPIYLYKLAEEYPINKVLENSLKNCCIENGELNGELVISKGTNNVALLDSKSIYSAFQQDASQILQDLPGSKFDDDEKLLEQYKIYVKTSEDLVKRKQTVNSFYVTLNSILLGAIVSVLCAIGELPLLGPVNICWIIAGFAAIIGIVICYSWISILNSYADLNSSKMQVIINIEQHLALNLFDTEWTFVTQKLGNRRYKSFSQKEKFIAYLFGALYILLVILGVILAILL